MDMAGVKSYPAQKGWDALPGPVTCRPSSPRGWRMLKDGHTHRFTALRIPPTHLPPQALGHPPAAQGPVGADSPRLALSPEASPGITPIPRGDCAIDAIATHGL